MDDLADRIAIVGIGESEFSNGGGNRLDSLVSEACLSAIEDAGMRPDEVDAIVTDGLVMPKSFGPSKLSGMQGIEREFTGTSMVAGAGNVGGGPLLAAQAIASGEAENVLYYFGVNWASEREQEGAVEGGPYAGHFTEPLKRNIEIPFGWASQPVYLAGFERRHRYEYGTTKEQVGEVAVQTRRNATENAKAEHQDSITMDEYMESPRIAAPHTVHDCCLISDGAGAYVMTGADQAESFGGQPVYINGIGTGTSRVSSTEFLSQKDDLTTFPSATSGTEAFEMAGIEHDDLDFAEIYDCFSIVTLIQLEDLGFCAKGEGGRYVQEHGMTVGDAELPINTHGGLLSQAYLLGINHMTEAVKQLRHDADNQVADADIGLVAGWAAGDHGTVILGRDRQ
jgi:acetyl-CoA acetyltransferase